MPFFFKHKDKVNIKETIKDRTTKAIVKQNAKKLASKKALTKDKIKTKSKKLKQLKKIRNRKLSEYNGLYGHAADRNGRNDEGNGGLGTKFSRCAPLVKGTKIATPTNSINSAKPASGSDTSEGDIIRSDTSEGNTIGSDTIRGPGAIGRPAIERAIEPTSGPASGPAIRRQASGPAIGPARSAIEGIVSFDQGTFGVLLLRYFEATSSANCATSTTYYTTFETPPSLPPLSKYYANTPFQPLFKKARNLPKEYVQSHQSDLRLQILYLTLRTQRGLTGSRALRDERI
ncbi:hypothetical protein MBM_05978 [Drepanopeziza brunnea f. sp. 'multigermtubi' MB_m1]|uniref:Uncharacterized protein n=1 Tax=Marssonina brunnea f. sp. multigermtubi (strain MB_m1) TaxID=1072389 RepID=K1WU25_MARBU|nr:uncharacterized protein MBM_05978 [Drepanopeziza brunnea f. sp. 'multigermtubi' MB_m1]EKD15967.1 hypothetical protein MBM_05978 [Drepanopeziza brunnea f. sp. 'multigermtubi' MB_m1]